MMKNAYLNKWIMSASFKTHGPIILAFFLLTLIKVLGSTFFNSPWIFADETVYAETARNVIQGEFYSKLLYCQTYPPGYSLFLSVAYLISDNSLVSYHLMLVVNAILTSSIILPAYYILKKYCPNKFSMAGSIFIALLPSVILYNFVVMSENLFIPLFTFSLWFLLESFETNSKKWGILAGFSIFLLFFTRIPGIAMIIGFFFALVYHSLKQIKSKEITLLLKEHASPIIAFSIPTFLWTVYKLNFGMAAVSGYNNDVYVSSVIHAVSNTQSFIQFLFLALHEMQFLILSSYFIFFILAIYWIHEIFWNDANNQLIVENRKNTATKSGIIYAFISSIILIFITVTHMFAAVVLQGESSYQIFGRYIDPVIPIIILMGILGFHDILNKKFSESKKIILTLVSINFLLVILFLLYFPSKNYRFPNMFSIFYIQNLPDQFSFNFFIILLVGLGSGIFLLCLYYKKIWYLILIFLVIFSFSGINDTIRAQYNYSSITGENNHSIADYLADHANASTRILMSTEDYSSDYGIVTWYSTQFFIQGYLIQNANESRPGDSNPQRIDYIISQKILSHNVLAVEKTGFKLYDITDRKEKEIYLPYTVNIGSSGDKLENFYSDMWTKNYSRILIEYPKIFGDMDLSFKINAGNRPYANTAHIVVKCNGQELENISSAGNNETLTVIVPETYLKDYFQICEIDTNTWRPSDYGSPDSRYLGIRLEEISINNITQKD